MATILNVMEPREGDTVKLKGQIHCPIMTIAAVANGIAVCVWFTEDSHFGSLQTSLNALDRVQIPSIN